jgi:Type II secretion system (T2SS), protein F
MVLTSVALAVAAVLLWPAPRARAIPRGPGIRRAKERGGGVARSATVGEAASALALVAAALRSGVGSLEALESVARIVQGAAGRELAIVAAAHRWGEAPDAAWARVGPGWQAAAVSWHAAHTAGAAPAGLLAAAATRMQDEESRRVEAAVQRAGVLLVLPLGTCFLPGFVATTVVPVVLLLLGGLMS